MTIWTHGLVNRLVILCDVAMIAIAGLVFGSVWQTLQWQPLLALSLLGTAAYISVMGIGQAYRVEHYRHLLRQTVQIIIGWLAATATIFVFYWALAPDELSQQPRLIIWDGLALSMLIIGRVVLVRIGVEVVHRKRLLAKKAVVIGDLDMAYDLIRTYQDLAGPGALISVMATFRDGGREASQNERNGRGCAPMLGEIQDLLEFAKVNEIDAVIITRPWNDMQPIGDLAHKLRRIATDVIIEVEPDVLALTSMRLMRIADRSCLKVQQQPLKGSLILLKTLEDYTVAILGLLFLSPVLLAAALAIKLESPGPILFRQIRVGLNRREFKVYKLRTMRFDPADDGSVAAVRADPRVTRVGALLRSLSIDEIPQLINVLRGEMSVVGPRPHVPNMWIANNLRYEEIDDYVARSRMKPGITGWAQINGMRGGIYTVEKAMRGIELDLYYIENWSLWFDIQIILLTLTKGVADNSAF